MRQGDRRTALQRVRKAEAIIDELRVTLDHDKGGEMSSPSQVYRVGMSPC